MARLSKQDIGCPDPADCPVAQHLPDLRVVALDAGAALYRVYDATWGYDEHNPGHGDARFTPIDDPASRARLPSIYLAATPTAALLETVLHDVHHQAGRTVYERDLRGKLLAHVRVPAIAALADLRDPELDRVGLTRGQVASSPAEHYPCTRRLAIAALNQRHGQRPLQGLIWHSRQAEVAGEPPTEVMVVYGRARYPSRRGSWRLFGPGALTLFEGRGRLLVEEIAEKLGAVIELER